MPLALALLEQNLHQQLQLASGAGAATGAAVTVAGFTAFNAPVLMVDFSAEVAPNARR